MCCAFFLPLFFVLLTGSRSQIVGSLSNRSWPYIVNNGSSSNICLMVEVDLEFNVQYSTSDDTWKMTTWSSNSSNPANYSGVCSSDQQYLNLSSYIGSSSASWTLQLLFRNTSGDHFSLVFVNLTFFMNNDSFPEAKNNGSRSFVRNDSIFTCSLNSYFQCVSPQTYPLTGSDPSSLKVKLTMAKLKAQAYRNDPSTDFIGDMVPCSADFKPNQIVPIIVGVALALMIIIAIVTFLVASRRRRNRYQEI